jgi:chromosome segregation ATPase
MSSSQNPQKDSNLAAGSDSVEFEHTLQAVERSLQDLKDRYTQVQQDQTRQSELQQRLDQVRSAKTPELQAELQTLQQQLSELEIALESRLFSWDGLREAFWQAVRFGGLGVILGWSLAFYTLNHPDPRSLPPTPAQTK